MDSEGGIGLEKGADLPEAHLNGFADAGRITGLAVHHAPIGIALVALDGTWLRVNAELCRLLGYGADELLATSFQAITHPDDLTADLSLLDATLAGELPGYRMEKRYLRADGSIVWAQLDVVLVRDGGEPLYFISQLQDIGFRKDAEARLSQLALHDILTGLPNRLLFRDRLDQSLRRNQRAGQGVAVGFIDLDNFKLINDTRGHDVGDQLLLRAARRMESTLRPGDTLARFGGDEFVALIDDVSDEATVKALADRLLVELERPVVLESETFTITASIGLVLGRPGATVDDLLRHADLAMYEAKRQGKNRTAIYTQVLEEIAVNRVETERHLRRSLDHADLFPAYQPVVDLVTGAVNGYEMLARWDRPDVGEVVAADFIDVADAAGLLPRITATLIEQATEHVDVLGAAEGMALLVNVTPDVLAAPAMLDRLRALGGALPDPGQLVLEMTEDHLLRLDGSAAQALDGLRATGIRFSVDDFGTGYSALGMLSRLRPDVIKIDRSFVADLGHPYPRAIVRALCSMAADLGILTIGEGVEEPGQLELLRELGCTSAQGYLLGRPLRAELLPPR